MNPQHSMLHLKNCLRPEFVPRLEAIVLELPQDALNRRVKLTYFWIEPNLEYSLTYTPFKVEIKH